MEVVAVKTRGKLLTIMLFVVPLVFVLSCVWGWVVITTGESVSPMQRIRSPNGVWDVRIEAVALGMAIVPYRARISIEKAALPASTLPADEILLIGGCVNDDCEGVASELEVYWTSKDALRIKIPPGVQVLRKHEKVDGIQVQFVVKK